MAISRRKFVAQSSGFIFSATPFLKTFAANVCNSKKILVLIYLAGGNDWINTIIPYLDQQYYAARPHLAVPGSAALPLNDSLAFHPAFSPLKALYDQNKIAILLNVGSDRPTLSHHKAMENWQDKDLSELSWLGRYAKLATKTGATDLLFPTFNVEPSLTPISQIASSFLSPQNQFSFDTDIHYRLDLPRNEIAKPAETERQNPFAQGLEKIADLIKQNYNATVYNISLGGFDTHHNQLEKHSSLLKMLADGIFSFQNNLETNGLADQVLTVVYSEFGRSLKENDDKGTDHGLINHILVIGNRAKGGIYGQYDSQSNNYAFNVRQVYAAFLDDWLGCQSEIILGEKFENPCFI